MAQGTVKWSIENLDLFDLEAQERLSIAKGQRSFHNLNALWTSKCIWILVF
jgi:hypothetical protein